MKTKYKQTEIGLIPEDWEVKTIDEIADVKGRVGWKGYTKKDLRSSGPYTIGAKHINKNNKLDLSDPTYLSFEKFLQSPDIMVIKNDVLIVQRGTIGKVVIIDREIGNATINPSMLILRVQNPIPHFIYYYLISEGGQRQIFIDISSTGVPMITQKQVNSFQIPFPPLPEQKAIAEVLSDVDSLIQAIEQKLAKKRAIKQGAMQKLLTPKKDWERVSLNDVIEVNRGGSPRPIQDYITTSNNGVNWIKIGDTSRTSKYITSSKEKIIQEGILNSREVKVGDFLLSNSMSFGRPYILKIDGCIHDGWLVLQNYQNSFDREFLYYTLMSKDVYNQYLTKASGSGVLNLNKELVKTIELNMPKTIEEQIRIATILSDMDKEIELIEKQLAKYQVLKQGLMQELLTGRIRLTV